MTKGVILIIIIVLLGVGLIMYGNRQSPDADMLKRSFEGVYDEVVVEGGIHYHPELTIYVKGEKQEISADIGIGPQYKDNKFYDPMMNMTDIHTHDSSGVLHWEVMSGPTKKGHLRIGNFFEIWGKPLGSGSNVKMLVNGQSNMEFENYLVKDQDKIEIYYE